jgi:DNA repair exonuclease SbcCD ATPase subunit
LVLGKFKKDALAPYQKETLINTTENFDIIEINDFIKIFQQKKEFSNLDEGIYLLDILSEYSSITRYNTDLIVQYSNLVLKTNKILIYNQFLRNKEQLNKELKLSKIKSKSSDVAAKTDLLNKLNSSLTQRNEQLKYLEEDYYRLKNQRDQVQGTIDEYKSQIMDLNKRKKEYFNQINKITREIDDPNQDLKKDGMKNVSMSKRIKSLQNQAKEAQFEINQIKKKLNESNLKYQEVNPKYEKIENDYQKLKDALKEDENRIITLKNELKEKAKERDSEFEEYDFSKLNEIKPSHEIEGEINLISEEISKLIDNMDESFNKKKPDDFSGVIKEASAIKDLLKKSRDKIIISENQAQVTNKIEELRKLETLMKELEAILNVFLFEINLKSNFLLMLNDDNKNFSIYVRYIRTNKKEYVNFDSLTTPEKVFFIVTLYISIHICLDSKNITFSNLFVPSNYNKRGSIYRTIRKILPLFESKESLKNINLIFILSNLEMKEPIENLKVISIEKTGD